MFKEQLHFVVLQCIICIKFPTTYYAPPPPTPKRFSNVQVIKKREYIGSVRSASVIIWRVLPHHLLEVRCTEDHLFILHWKLPTSIV